VRKGSSSGPPLRLQIVEGRQEGTTLDLEGPVIIGRSSARATFVIQDSEASRRHASLIPEGQSANVQDLGSTNGTFVNDERIEERHALEVGDRIRIGTTVLELTRTEAAEPAEAEVPEEAEPEEAAKAEAPAEAEEPEREEPEAVAETEEVAEPAEPEAEEPAEPEEPLEEPEEPSEAEEPAEVEEPPVDAAADAEARRAAEVVVAAEAVAKVLHRRLDESFSEVLHAWSNRDPEKMQPYVSRAHLERAREAADQLDRDYQINYIKGLELRDAAVRRPAGDPRAEPLEVYVSFVALDWIEDLRSGEVIDGDASEPQAFTERWTFVEEGRRGWVIDVVEAVWSGPAEGTDPEDWLGLPPGSYSRRSRPSAWRHWDGVVWDAVPAATG